MAKKIFLIGNYPPDRQESMERFTLMLAAGFTKAGQHSVIWRPGVLFGKLANSTTNGFGKWLGYIDKWIIFPVLLRWRVLLQGRGRSENSYHICDHSNSPYLAHLPAAQTVITCHDVLAIRGALGYGDAYVGASRAGKILQQWILSRLTSARKLAAVSDMTFDQLKDLNGSQANPKNWKVIHNAFNADFGPMPATEAGVLLQKAGIEKGTRFLLHVGSDLPRKNRKLLIDMLAELGSHWTGKICYAGEPLEEALVQYAAVKGVKDRIISLIKPDHATLVALYSACEAFVFPSLSEGFGWPVIEAQACGAPVIASNFKPMPEVSGGAALHADPFNASEFAQLFLSLDKNGGRSALVSRGFHNSERFNLGRMTSAYLELHQAQD